MPVKYFAFDTETTGLNPHQGDEIISIAFMLLDDTLFCVKKGCWYVNPSEGKTVSEGAAATNGHTPEKWAALNAITQDELVDRLIELWANNGLERALPLGHNVSFDLGFLDALALRYPRMAAPMKKALAYHKIDTLPLAVALDQAHTLQASSYSLVALAKRWGIALENAHDALEDIGATVGVYTKFVAHLKQSPLPPEPVAAPFLDRRGDTFCFRYGKYKGSPVSAADTGYLRWALNNVKLETEERRELEMAFAQVVG